MKFARDLINSQYLIEAYEPGWIQIGGKKYHDNLLLMPNLVHQAWAIQSIDALEAHQLEQLLEFTPDMILFGTGSQQYFLHPQVLAPLMAAGVGYEMMPTDAACRTFNILLTEDRRVLAALIL